MFLMAVEYRKLGCQWPESEAGIFKLEEQWVSRCETSPTVDGSFEIR